MTREPKYICPRGHVVKHTCKELTIEPLHWFCKDCRSTYTDDDVTLKSKVITQRALIEQQAGVIRRQWDYIEQLKQTISVHEQAGMEGLIRDYNDHQRIEQQAKEIARLTELAKGYHDLAENQRNDIEQQAREIERLKDLNERLKIEAQGHAQEARTANATIAEIYQCVSGATGEVGNWHGAQPVRDVMDKQAKEIAFHVSRVEALRRFLSEKITECQKQAKEIAQLKINHTDINVEFDRLNGVITRQMEDIERLTELAKGYHDTAENRTNDIEQQGKEIARLRDTLERISRHVPIMGSTGDYRQGQLDVLESVKRIAEEHS